MIVLPNDIKLQIVGNPGSKLVKEMLIEYNEGVEDLKLDSSILPDLIIYLGNSRDFLDSFKAKISEDPKPSKPSVLISILNREDYNFIESFCLENKLPLLVASPKKTYKSYSNLKLPIYHYINISLSMVVSVLIKNRYILDSEESKNQDSSGLNPILLNIDQELLSVAPDKFFQLRWFPKDNSYFFWEPGTNLTGIQMTMEWMLRRVQDEIEAGNPFEVHTIIDIDEIPKKMDSKEYLLYITLLAQYQRSFLIVNTEFDNQNEEFDSEDQNETVHFDYLVYTSLMEVWNNTHFIPRRKQLSDFTNTLKDYGPLNPTVEGKKYISLDFDMSIRKPPIFILDNFESVKNFLESGDSSVKKYILYLGKKDNFLKIV